jgi:hypothetical protein
VSQHAIIDKLRQSLSVNEYAEPTVCYAFVEMRKLLEKLGMKEEFRLIIFYADWVVHPVLDRGKAKSQLREIEAMLVAALQANPDADIISLILPFLSLGQLRQELSKFFQIFDLPKTALEDGWNSFTDNLMSIICDCPLVMLDKDSLIREFAFRPQLAPGDVVFEVLLSNNKHYHEETNRAALNNAE